MSTETSAEPCDPKSEHHFVVVARHCVTDHNNVHCFDKCGALQARTPPHRAQSPCTMLVEPQPT